MKTRFPSLLAMLAWMAVTTPAYAVYGCSVSSPGFSIATALTTRTVAQTSATITCTKAANDAAAMNYSLGAGKGQNPQGQSNRATFGGSTVAYNLYQDSSCNVAWKSSGVDMMSGSLTFQSATSGSWDITYWGCIPAAAPLPPAGTYTDLVSLTLSYGPKPQLSAENTFPVNIATPWLCSLSSPPGDVAFGIYVAFGGALTASTSFGLTCTQYMPYTLSLSAAGGTIAGLDYTLSLSTTNSTGTGAPQTHYINGSMAAGQSGTCSIGTCPGSQQRILTITY
jgi:spore coat protein U-like protein